MPQLPGQIARLCWRSWKKNNGAVPAKVVAGRLVPLGEIVGTHGIEGWLKVKLYNPETALLSSAREIFLEKNGLRSSHLLRAIKPHRRLILIRLEGCDGIGEAKERVGSILSVTEEILEPPKPGEYYYYQVLGFEVLDREGRLIGKVTRIWFKGGGDLFVVSGASKEFLIPAVKEVVEKIDFPGGKIVINPPPGLLDL